MALKRAVGFRSNAVVVSVGVGQLFRNWFQWMVELNFVTAFVPSDTACLANSPGSRSRTAVWISRLESVRLPFILTSLEASFAIRSKMSATNEFIMDMALDDTPVSG